jgi:hypothetical protein
MILLRDCTSKENKSLNHNAVPWVYKLRQKNRFSFSLIQPEKIHANRVFLFYSQRTSAMSFNYTKILDEDLSREDPRFWNRPTPVDCNPIRIIGILLCVASLLGIVFNGALFYSFVRYKALRSPSNVFVMFIAGLGLFASCTILPLTGTSSIYCYWLYNRVGCQLGAVIAFWYGCSSSYLLCGVSLSRCYIIVRPFKAKDVTVSKS